MNTQSSKKFGVGIVGVGNWGRYGHIPVLRLLPNYEIVAVASRREEYGKQLANEFGIPHVFREPAELIGHPNVKPAFDTPWDCNAGWARARATSAIYWQKVMLGRFAPFECTSV